MHEAMPIGISPGAGDGTQGVQKVRSTSEASTGPGSVAEVLQEKALTARIIARTSSNQARSPPHAI
eukprot:1146041-Pelagomonas_calceolata.AAC.2